MEILHLVVHQWALLVQLLKLNNSPLFFLHRLIKPLDHSVLLVLKLLCNVHDLFGLDFLLLDPGLVLVAVHVHFHVHLRVLVGLALLLDLFHFEVVLLLVGNSFLSALLDEVLDFVLLLLDVIPNLTVLVYILGFVSLIDKLLGLSMVVESRPVPIFFCLELVVELLLQRKLLLLDMVHFLDELSSILGIPDPFGGFLLFLSQLDDPCLNFNLLVLGHLEIIESFHHFVLWLGHDSAEATLELAVGIWSVHLTAHAHVHLLVISCHY